MGIFCKYNLSTEANHLLTFPSKLLYCDRFIVEGYNIETGFELDDKEFDTWEEVLAYFVLVYEDEFYTHYIFTCTGLVFD